jgi:hypothetical protein
MSRRNGLERASFAGDGSAASADSRALDHLFSVTARSCRLASVSRETRRNAEPYGTGNEAWLKLAGSPHSRIPRRSTSSDCRAPCDRSIEAARRRHADKRGAGAMVVTFDESIADPADEVTCSNSMQRLRSSHD